MQGMEELECLSIGVLEQEHLFCDHRCDRKDNQGSLYPMH
jgi:hypothetical protein